MNQLREEEEIECVVTRRAELKTNPWSKIKDEYKPGSSNPWAHIGKTK